MRRARPCHDLKQSRHDEVLPCHHETIARSSRSAYNYFKSIVHRINHKNKHGIKLAIDVGAAWHA